MLKKGDADSQERKIQLHGKFQGRWEQVARDFSLQYAEAGTAQVVRLDYNELLQVKLLVTTCQRIVSVHWCQVDICLECTCSTCTSLSVTILPVLIVRDPAQLSCIQACVY